MKAFLLALFMALAITPSFAATKAGPSIRPVYEPDGRFGFCIANYDYPDGRKITLALSPVGQINMGITIPKGGFKIGSHYDLSYILDEESDRKVRAEALDEETLLLQMGSNLSFRKKISRAKTMKVGVSSNMLTFDLPPMDKLIDGLVSCIAAKKNTKDAKVAKAESALPETLKALLVTAGFTEIVPLSMEQIPAQQRPADFIWRNGNLIAGVRERIVPQDKTLSDLIGLHMKGLKEKCEGRFRADIGREQTVGGLRVRLAEASCAPKDSPDDQGVFVGVLFYLTSAGEFTVFTHECLMENKAESLAARDKLAKTVLSLAKE